MPKVDISPLEDIFRAEVLKMLKKEEKITDEIINLLMSWRHSGFSAHNEVRVSRDDEDGREKIGQYIIRNTFSEDKLTYNEDTVTVIYHSKMTHGKNKKNFSVYTAEEFIAAITQHIPEKSFQMMTGLSHFLLLINKFFYFPKSYFVGETLNLVSLPER